MAKPKRLLLASFGPVSYQETGEGTPGLMEYARANLRKKPGEEPPAYATIGEGEPLVDDNDRW